MPSTHVSLHYHIVFSTKDRHPFIKPKWQNDLYGYLGGCVKTANAVSLAINGTEDHVHLLVGLRATHCLADFVQDIKQTSSKWIHKFIGEKQFAWQPGYGAFTVSSSNLDAVIKYIGSQEEHHRKKTFQEEYLAFLEKHAVAYDPKYLW